MLNAIPQSELHAILKRLDSRLYLSDKGVSDRGEGWQVLGLYRMGTAKVELGIATNEHERELFEAADEFIAGVPKNEIPEFTIWSTKGTYRKVLARGWRALAKLLVTKGYKPEDVKRAFNRPSILDATRHPNG
jgi:hypothetical protein